MIQVMKVLSLVNKKKHLQTAAKTAHFKMGLLLFLGGVCSHSLTKESQDNHFNPISAIWKLETDWLIYILDEKKKDRLDFNLENIPAQGSQDWWR